jgi:hypothetical protein
MHLGKGDRVKFLNDTGGGIITEIIDKKTAMVMTGDGFEIPVPVSELVLSEKHGNSPREEDDHHDIPADGIDAGTGNADKENDLFAADGDAARGLPERNVLVAFAETGTGDRLDAWLINDSSFSVLYSLLLRKDELYSSLKAGMIEADTKIYIKTFSREQLNSFLSLQIQAIFFMGGIFNPVPPSSKEIELDPVEIYGEGKMAINDFFEEKACIIPLISDPHEQEVRKISELEIKRIYSEKITKPVIKLPKKPDQDAEEVDLHIEELVDDHSGLLPGEVLEIQISRFTTALEGAIKGRTRKIIFIHGIGQGRLKFEIRKTLDRKYPQLKYQDASFKEYGYGATMVIIRK